MRRRPVAALLLATMLLGACGGQDHSAPPDSSGGPEFGFADATYTDQPGARDATEAIRRVVQAGARVTRILIRWSAVQPSASGPLTWTQIDPYIRGLAGHGVRPLVMITSAPTWAQDPADNCGFPLPDGRHVATQFCPPSPKQLPAWQRFVAAVVQRYRNLDLAGLEVWNEPNFTIDWQTAKGPDAERYTALLRAAAEAARKVEPSLRIVFAGMPGVATDPVQHTVDPSTFLRNAYAAGAKGAFDAIGVHPYTEPGPGLPTPGTDRFRTQVSAIRAVRDGQGDRGRPLWITELGFATGMPAQTKGVAGAQPQVSEREQADGLIALYDAAARMPDVKLFLAYRIKDDADSPFERGFGVLRSDWTPKPAFCRLQARFGTGSAQGC